VVPGLSSRFASPRLSFAWPEFRLAIRRAGTTGAVYFEYEEG
jgi:hypothetical protein